MKLKSLLSISSLFLVLAVVVSSCSGSFNIAKKRHSNGYYVNIGSDNHDGEGKADSRRDKRRDLANLIEEQAKNNNPASALEGSKDINGKNSNNDVDFRNDKLSTDQIAAAEEFSKMSTLKKIQALKKLKKKNKLEDNTDFMLVLLLVLAVILPPVGIYVKNQNVSNQFWTSLLLCAAALVFFAISTVTLASLFGLLGFVFWLAAAIHAVLYVLR
jgi:uncharacterized membrane protein YqaE (UPF0057 family)